MWHRALFRGFRQVACVDDRGTYRGTSHTRNSDPQGPFSKTMPRARRCSKGGGLFRISKVPLYYHGSRLRGSPNPKLQSPEP